MKTNTELTTPSRPAKGTPIRTALQYKVTIKKPGGKEIAEVVLNKRQLDRLRSRIVDIGAWGINGESFAIEGAENTITVACEEIPNE